MEESRNRRRHHDTRRLSGYQRREKDDAILVGQVGVVVAQPGRHGLAVKFPVDEVAEEHSCQDPVPRAVAGQQRRVGRIGGVAEVDRVLHPSFQVVVFGFAQLVAGRRAGTAAAGHAGHRLPLLLRKRDPHPQRAVVRQPGRMPRQERRRRVAVLADHRERANLLVLHGPFGYRRTVRCLHRLVPVPVAVEVVPDVHEEDRVGWLRLRHVDQVVE